MVFLTLYFQLLGMSDFAASLQIGLLLGSSAVGGLLGGWIGDKAGARWPDKGRIAVCQFSVFTGIPFSIIITKVKLQPEAPMLFTSLPLLSTYWHLGFFETWTELSIILSGISLSRITSAVHPLPQLIC